MSRRARKYNPKPVHSNAVQIALARVKPLTDDGDALRLAVKLGLRVETPKYKGYGSTCGNQVVFQDGCPCAQTRRAIVRAAAALAVG